MNPFPWIDESFSLKLVVTLIHFVWQGAAVGLIVVVAGWLLKRAAAQVRYSLNVAAMLLMVVCLPVTFAFVDVRQDAGAVSQLTMAGSGTPDHELLTAGGSPSAFASPADLATPPMFTSDTKIEPDNRSLYTVPSQSAETTESTLSQALAWLIWAAPYVTAVYFLGVALMMLRLSTALWGGHKLRRASSPVDDDSLLMMVQRQARGIGLKIAPAVAFCEQISIPVVVGVVKPMILLPAALASGLSPDQLQLLVTHELAHIRRYDLFVNLLQRLSEAVLFFHPAVWFVSRRVSIERENAADDLVLTVGCQSAHYADALVRMAELSSALRNSRIANQATALAASGTNASEFKRRVLRLLENTDTPKLRLTRGGILAMMLIATSLLVTPVIVQSWTNSAVGADELTNKYEALQGTWGVESFRKDGIPDPSVVGYRVRIDGNVMTMFQKDGSGIETRFVLSAKQDVNHIDAFENDRPSAGIYQLDGDTLRICVRVGSPDVRPTRFRSSEGDGTMLTVLKRISGGSE